MPSSNRNLPHIKLDSGPLTEEFRLSGSGGDSSNIQNVGNRSVHGVRLFREFEDALASEDIDRENQGTIVTFVSFEGLRLALTSLESLSPGEQPVLLSVVSDGTAEWANVWIPENRKGFFLDRLQAYIDTADADSPDNANLVDGIRSIRRATLKEIWTDPPEYFPTNPSTPFWWEVWLRRFSGDEIDRFVEATSDLKIQVLAQYLGFNDRSIVLAHASIEQLSQVYSVLDDIAELRRPSETTNSIANMGPVDQQNWADSLMSRLDSAGRHSPAVTILDTGVQQNHPLLSHSLAESDVHVIDPNWSVRPVCGHGTEMAGLALYGDMAGLLTENHPVTLRHRLESVKMLPDLGSNAPTLYGFVTAQAVDRPEIQAPERRRVFLLATTASDEQLIGVSGAAKATLGQPTSWSSMIDILAFGSDFDEPRAGEIQLNRKGPRTPRLFVISAGNIRDFEPIEADHLDRSDLATIEDPAQAWNAITVGAYAGRDSMAGSDSMFEGYVPVAKRGELAPSSRTTVSTSKTAWPFKPEVVADGGNWAISPDKFAMDRPDSLGLLTTKRHPLGAGQFTTTFDTSAATAQVAEIAADILAEYPDLNPETVRALVVHSAEWTDLMRQHFHPSENKEHLRSMVRRYGMGVPDKTRAIKSAANALTLVAEGRIHPYLQKGKSNDATIRGWHVHRLPWPVEELQALGATEARMRVTLSYFVEPNPSRRGWRDRYRYASHGLRFSVQRPDEAYDSFRERVNIRARSEETSQTSRSTESGWLFGVNHQKSPGSLHTDIWTGSAADLANKSSIGIYPIGGWWKERAKLDDSDRGVDYALVVSIETPEVETDLWTPVYQKVTTQTKIET